MKLRTLSAIAAAGLAVGLSACGRERSATESTGTATATVKTKAPETVVSALDLPQKAQTAAHSVSVPVNGMTADGLAANKTGNTTGK